MGGRFEWGVSDCCTAACDAFSALWGIDPMGSDRGAYGGPVGAHRILRRAGGYLAWCGDRFAAAGLRETDYPQAGDLVLLPHRSVGTLALCIQPGQFAGKGQLGVAIVGGSFQGAWTCRNC